MAKVMLRVSEGAMVRKIGDADLFLRAKKNAEAACRALNQTTLDAPTMVAKLEAADVLMAAAFADLREALRRAGGAS